jgi:YD repeat-containing protein
MIQSGPSGSVTSSITYDANANVKSITDFAGVVTNYTYDLVRNLETKRVEAAGTTVARTITTEWHPDFDSPSKVAEPKRLTTYSYDAAGNLLTKTVRATSDTNGSTGLAATPIGSPQVWTYTYDDKGQMLTSSGPRTDVNTTTTYSYDTTGNLATITNAAGHITTFSNYDAHGRAGRITDPNGLVTDVSYTPRGWVSSISVGGEVTSYDYDGVGQRTRAVMPDGSSVLFTYDPAHRLTDITDSFGNSIHYTLDGLGNRTKEETKDLNGALARQVSRVFNNLGLVKQVTGAVQ